MAKDNPKKKKLDSRRVALGQEHERRYLRWKIGIIAGSVVTAQFRLKDALESLEAAGRDLEAMAQRLHRGYPNEARRGGRKAGRK